MLDLTCTHCGAEYLGNERSKYCTDQCKWRSKAARRYAEKRDEILAARKARRAPNARQVRTCSKCSEKHYGLGYCVKHYSEHAASVRRVTVTCAACGANWEKSSRRAGMKLCWPCARKSSGKINATHAAKRREIAAQREEPVKVIITLPHVLICTHCREPFLSERQGKKYCTKRCSKEVQAINLGYRNRECRDCGTHLGYKSLKNLCASCQRSSLKLSRVHSKDARRARLKSCHYEPVNRIQIFERDKWICGLCDEFVDKSVSYPDPRSASLDHIVPLALGGDHTKENCQLAHLDCNIRKGAIVNRPNYVSVT